MVKNFADFCEELLRCGFSLGGGNAKGIYAIIDYDWQAPVAEGNPIVWHTGDPETDPWQWRIRVLEERDDIAYAKLFFGTSGYITEEWYPYFLAVRRNGYDFEDTYENGLISDMEKRVYNAIRDNRRIPAHELKSLCCFSKEENSRYEKAVTSLQMKMFITICGRARKLNSQGIEYGWDSAVFCTCEEFWGDDISSDISEKEAAEKIREQILKLNPNAEERKIRKFIYG